MAYTREQWEQRIKDAGDGWYEFVRWVVNGEFGSLKKCVVRCVIDEYEWSAEANNLVNKGTGCPKCSGAIGKEEGERINQINSIKNIEFLRWDGDYSLLKSKAFVRCNKDGFEWSTSINVLINGGHGCPKCAGNRRYTKGEIECRINSIESISFVEWVDGYVNSKSKLVARCDVDGFEWVSTVTSLLNKANYCPVCSGCRRWTAEERIEQINKLDNIEFVCWFSSYKNSNSKAIVRCKIDGFEWRVNINHLLNNGRGCPKCANGGYDPSKTGNLYALRSECGRYVKVGISNKPSRRHSELARDTPFNFHVIEQISGSGVKIAELEKYFHEKYERAGFARFDGATEWLICTPELLEELRNLGDKQ